MFITANVVITPVMATAAIMTISIKEIINNKATLIIVEAIMLTLIIKVIVAIQAIIVKMGMTAAMAITSIMAISTA